MAFNDAINARDQQEAVVVPIVAETIASSMRRAASSTAVRPAATAWASFFACGSPTSRNVS